MDSYRCTEFVSRLHQLIWTRFWPTHTPSSNVDTEIIFTINQSKTNPSPASLRVDFDGVGLLGNLNKSLAVITAAYGSWHIAQFHHGKRSVILFGGDFTSSNFIDRSVSQKISE